MTPAQQRITEVFVEVADSLTDDFDIIDLLQRLSERCVELLDVSAAGILLVDQYDQLQILAASDENTRLLELFALQHDQGPCVECYRSGTARTDIDLTTAAALTRWPHFTARARHSGFARTHAVPLRLRQRVVGALNLFQTSNPAPSPPRPTLARALADIATIAILQQRTLQPQPARTRPTADRPGHPHHHRTGQGHPRGALAHQRRRRLRHPASLRPQPPAAADRPRPPGHRRNHRHRHHPARHGHHPRRLPVPTPAPKGPQPRTPLERTTNTHPRMTPASRYTAGARPESGPGSPSNPASGRRRSQGGAAQHLDEFVAAGPSRVPRNSEPLE